MSHAETPPAFDPANPFAGLESDLDAPGTDQPRKFTDDFIQNSTAKFRVEVKCPRCDGSGSWHSFGGYSSGKCFRCKGAGKILVRPEPSPETKAAREAAKARKATREFNKQVAALEDWARRFPKQFAWLTTEAPRFSFALSLLDYLCKHHCLTDAQMASVDRCVTKKEALEVTRATPEAADALDLTTLPAGYYAVPEGETRLKIRIKKPGTNSKWHGYIFVSDGAAYGSGQQYGTQRPGQKYRGGVQPQLRAILADPAAASIAYGKLTGSCGICGRHLEDAISIERGIGPVCAAKQGW